MIILSCTLFVSLRLDHIKICMYERFYITVAVVAVIIIVIVVIFCFCGGGLLYICTNKNSSAAQDRSRPNRTSVDSVLSTISR